MPHTIAAAKRKMIASGGSDPQGAPHATAPRQDGCIISR